MTSTTPSTYGDFRPAKSDRDASWYGTLAMLAACLGLLAATGFMG